MSLLRSIRLLRHMTGLCFRSTDISFYQRNIQAAYVNTRISNVDLPFLQETSSPDAIYSIIEEKLNANTVIDFNDLQTVISNCSGLQDLQSRSITLLKCCGSTLEADPQDRIKLVDKLWNVLYGEPVILTEAHCLAFLQCYTENGSEINVKQFLDQVDCKGLQLTESILNALLLITCEESNAEKIFHILQKFIERKLYENKYVYGALSLLKILEGNLSAVDETLTAMKAAGIEPNDFTYTHILQGCAAIGDPELLRNYYEKAKTNKIFFNELQLFQIYKTAALFKHDELLTEILNWFPAVHKDVLESKAVKLIRVHCYKAAVALIMLPYKEPLHCNSYGFGEDFINEIIRQDCPFNEVIQISKIFIGSKKNLFTLHKVAQVMMELGKINEAIQTFEILKASGHVLRTHYFWPILVTAYKESGERGIYHTLEEMKRFEVAVDTATLTDYVLKKIVLVDPEVNIQELHKATNLPLNRIFPIFLKHLLSSGLISESVKIAKRYENIFTKLDVPRLHSILAKGFVSNPDVKSTVQLIALQPDFDVEEWSMEFISLNLWLVGPHLSSLLQELADAKIYVSKKAEENLRIIFDKENWTSTGELNFMGEMSLMEGRSKRSSSYKEWKDTLSETELEAHYLELKSKDMNPQWVLQRLLGIYVKKKNYDRALQIFEKLTEFKEAPTPGMTAKLLEIAIGEKDLTTSLKLYEQLKGVSNFQVDNFKVINLAKLLVENNRAEEAYQILTEFSPYGATECSIRCWELLEELSKRKEVKLTEKFFELLVKKGHCEISNRILGPVVRAYMHSNDLRGAVDTYIRLALNHKVTPLKLELLTKLIREEKNEVNLVDAVVNVSNGIVGTVEMQVILMVAYAKNGLGEEVKRIFENNTIFLGSKVVQSQCAHLCEKGEIEPLKTMVSALSYSKEVQSLLPHIFKIYRLRKDNEGAQSYLKELQEKNIKIPSEVRQLVSRRELSHKL